jgi:hypothetical protein
VAGAAALAGGLAAAGADLGHVLPIAADRGAAFAARRAGFLGCELVCGAVGMRGPAAGARDLALALRIHPGKPPPPNRRCMA